MPNKRPNIRDLDGTDMSSGHVGAFAETVVALEWATPTRMTTITNADSPYTVKKADARLYCDTSGGSITVNLPPSTTTLRKLEIMRAGASTVVIDGDGAETVAAKQGGGATFTLLADGDVAVLLDTNKAAFEWWLV